MTSSAFYRIATISALLLGAGAAVVSGLSIAQKGGPDTGAKVDIPSEPVQPRREVGYKFKYLGESDVMGKGELSALFGGDTAGKARDDIRISANGALAIYPAPTTRFVISSIAILLSVNKSTQSTDGMLAKLTGSSGQLTDGGSVIFNSDELNDDELAKNLVAQILTAAMAAPAKDASHPPKNSSDTIGPYSVEIHQVVKDGHTIVTEKRRYQPRSRPFIRQLKPHRKVASRGSMNWQATYEKSATRPNTVLQTRSLNYYIAKHAIGSDVRRIELEQVAASSLGARVTPSQGGRQVVSGLEVAKEAEKKEKSQALLAGLEALSDNSTKEDVTGLYVKIKAHLAANDDFAELLRPYLVNGKPASYPFRMSLLALATVGSPLAQRVMSDAMLHRADEWPAFQQLSMSLAHVDAPEPESVASLWQAHEAAQDTDLAHHALYSYGTILRGLQTNDPSHKLVIDGYKNLIGHLEQSTSKVAGLIALGNFGYKAQEGALAPYLASPIVRVRAEATSALRFVPTLSAEAKIVDILLTETEEEVRLSAARALEMRFITSSTSDALLQLLHSERSSLVIKAIVKTLLANRHSNPSVESGLREYMATEISPDIYRYIAENI